MLNNKPKSIKPTSESIVDIHLNEIFDLENLQRLQDLFADAHQVASIITHPDGTPITQPSQFSGLCSIIRKTEKGCANCFKSDALLGRHHPSGPIVQPCLSGGLWDAGASITVNGQHVASWLIGQVRNEAVDEQSMLKYAEEIGADPDDFMEAFYQVPIMSVEQFHKVSKMLFAFANELSEKGYINLQLKRQMAEHDRATILLKASEERFRSLFNKAPLGYQSLNVDGCFIEVNQQWLNLLGYKREEVIGKWFGDFLSPAYVNGFRNRFPLFKAQGHIHSEFEMVHKNGHIIFIAFEGKIGYELNGDFKQTHCILQDITERKKIEEALIKSEKHLNDSQTIAHLGTYSWDMATGFWSSSKIMDEIFGIDQNYVRSLEGWTNIVHPMWQKLMADYVINDVIGKRQRFDKQYKIIRQNDGQERWVHGIGELEFDTNNNPISLVGTISDISKVKHTEEIIRNSELMLKTVLDNFPGVVFWKDTESNYLGCNLSFAKGAGLTSTVEIIGKTDFDLPWAASEAENYRADDFEVMKSGKAKMHILEMQHQAEGQVIWLDTCKIPMFDANEQVIGVIGVSTDITEMKQIQEVISAKNKELENYLYIASHDLRSPLVNIQGFSQRLQKQTDTIKTILSDSGMDQETRSAIDKITNEDIPKTLSFVFSNVTKMDILINGLLKISRTGRMTMTIGKVDMTHLFKNIISAHNFQITELQARVTMEDLHDCFGDANLLNQLFSNIIGNAIKYSDQNRQLVLEITSIINYNKVIYSIKDSGIGIESRHLERIWDVFYRIDSGVSLEGEGIGLSIAKRIVDKHKGKIWAESEVGKGSTFFIELQKNEFSE